MSQSLRNQAVQLFKQNLKSNSSAMEYLKSRGLSESAIDFFNIGYADGNLRPGIETKGFSLEDMFDSRLFCKSDNGKEYEFFRNRIIFPTVVLGNALYMSGRDFGGKSDRKYLNLAVPNNNLINEELLMYNPQYVILTEGYMDCYSLILNKFPAVGIAGCHRKKKGLLDKIMRVPKIYIMFDYDSNGSGQKGSIKTAYALCRLGHKNVRIINTPPMGQSKMDINEMFISLKGGFKEVIKDLTKQALTPFHETERFMQMEKEELTKELVSNDVPTAEALHIYMDILGMSQINPKLLRCLCPFHKEKTPSFTVFTDNAYATCFGCGISFESVREFQDAYKATKASKIE